MNTKIYRNTILSFIYRTKFRNTLFYYKKLMVTQWLSREELKEIQLVKLKKLLYIASNNVPFYKNMFNKCGLSVNPIKEIEEIKKIPPLTKNMLRNNTQNDFLSSKKNQKKQFMRRTSGTSGTPVTIFVNNDIISQSLAARHRFESSIGIEIGEKQARFWGRSLENPYKEHFRDLILNRYRFPFATMDDEKNIQFIKKLNKVKPSYFYGYTSMIDRFASFVQEKGIVFDFKLKAVITTAENLLPSQKRRITNSLNTKVYNEYGCSEIDIIATECEMGSLHINMENVLVETDMETNEALITDLNNTYMPLIRYKIGDFLKVEKSNCPCGRNSDIIKSIEGRTSEVQFIQLPGYKKVHSVYIAHIIDEIIKKGFPILQFQIIQVSLLKLEIYLVVLKTNFDQLYIKNLLIKKIHSQISKELSLEIIFSNEYINEKAEKKGYFQSQI